MGLDAKSWTLVVHNLANRAISLGSEGVIFRMTLIFSL